MSYATMTLADLVATGHDNAHLDATDILLTFGTDARYSAHVAVWRLARLVSSYADDVNPVWTVQDCTCGILSMRKATGAPMFKDALGIDSPDGTTDYAPTLALHQGCGGHSDLAISGRAAARIGKAMATCTCAGHVLDSLDNAQVALDKAIATAAREDAAWAGLSSVERAAATYATPLMKDRLHFQGGRGCKDAAATVALLTAAAPAAPVAPAGLALDLASLATDALSEMDLLDHTCGPRNARETWSARNARCKACDACRVEREYVSPYGNPAGLSAPASTAGIIRGDRVASKGRNAQLGSGQGGARIASA